MPLPLDALLGFGQRLFRLRPDEAENALPSGLQASPVGCRQGRQHQHKTVRGRRLELVAESHLHPGQTPIRSEEHTSELQSHSDLVCRLLLEKKKKKK